LNHAGGLDAFISSRAKEEQLGGGMGAAGAAGAGGDGTGGLVVMGGGGGVDDADERALAARDSEDAAVLTRPADSGEECAQVLLPLPSPRVFHSSVSMSM